MWVGVTGYHSMLRDLHLDPLGGLQQSTKLS